MTLTSIIYSWDLARCNQELAGLGFFSEHRDICKARKAVIAMAREMKMIPSPEVVAKEIATIYCVKVGKVQYKIAFIDGVASSIDRYKVQLFDAGTVESGPSLCEVLVFDKSLDCSRVWFEDDLLVTLEDIIDDCESYSAKN